MALTDVNEYLKMIPMVMSSPRKYVWMSYDADADALYINFKKPSRASDSEMTDDGIIIRYEDKEIIGITILNASKRDSIH